MPSFIIDPSVKIGDILTSLSIIISVIALLNALSKERAIRRREQADKIRSAAAKTLTKLERWQELMSWYFEYIQPLFVHASEQLAKDQNIITARDFLWRELSSSRIAVKRIILDEAIETAYADLYGYHPAVFQIFVETMNKLKMAEESNFSDFLERTQDDVLTFQNNMENYTSAMLGNKLRATTAESQSALRQKADKTLQPIYEFLVALVSESDDQILKRDTLPVSTAQ